MILKIKKITLNNKLIIYTVGLLIISGLIIGIAGFRLTKDALDRKGEVILENGVKSAMLYIEEQYAFYERGDVSIEVVQEGIKESLLGEMKADGTRVINNPIDLGEYGYFIIYDSKGNEVMHPFLEGENVWDVVDQNRRLKASFYLVQDKIQKAKNGGGFTHYTWDVPFENRTAQKVVYSEYFEPWDWVVTAGTYMEDFNAEAIRIIQITLFVLLIVMLIGFILTKNYISGIAIPLMEVERAMKSLSDGKYKYLETIKRKDEVGRLVSGYNQMLGAIEEKDKRLEYFAYFDELSGLSNRHETRQRINKKIHNGACAHLVLMDIKDFKTINSVYGSDYGDEIIRNLGETVIKLSSDTLEFSRLSGNEFAIWIEKCAESEVTKILNQVKNEIKNQLSTSGYPHHLSFHIGGCKTHEAIDDYDGLYKKAAVALQYAKEHDNFEYVSYENSMLTTIERASTLLKHAEIDLKEGHFHLYYQGKVDISNKKVLGVEALARWFSDELGFISPGEFIPVLNKTQLMIDFSEFVIHKALEDYPKLEKKYGQGITLAINICPTLFYQENFVGFIVSALGSYKVHPEKLILEITEDLLITDVELVNSKIQELRSLGIKISLDDFGTGFSSLNYLRSFPLDEVKIDRMFIKEIHKNKRDLSMLKSIVDLAQTLNYMVVAEGIEYLEQIQCLQEVNCKVAQGFYFYKPEPLEP
jgi:diguanylate cyclase (GGDEF)-like protein